MTVKIKIFVARCKIVGEKLLFSFLGCVIGASGVFVSLEAPKLLQPQIIVFQNVSRIEKVHAKQPKEQKEMKNTLKATFTAYSAGDGFTPSLIMASGKKVYVGAMACPRSLPIGTVIEVHGKKYTCEDRMAKRFDGNFDIYMATKEEALQFGKKELEYVVDK